MPPVLSREALLATAPVRAAALRGGEPGSRPTTRRGKGGTELTEGRTFRVRRIEHSSRRIQDEHMKPRLLLLFSSLVLLPACHAPRGAAWKGDLASWGTLREALRDGSDQERVRLTEVGGANVYGLGALAGLAGEVTIVDGEVWVTRGDSTHVTTRGRSVDEGATVLFTWEVERWQDVRVRTAVDPSELEVFVEARAREAGIDTSRPFPFLVKGTLEHLDVHVVNGECPIRARMMGNEASANAFRLSTPSTPGILVGIFAPDSVGVVCHMGSRTHVHAVLEENGGLTGHVETVGLAAGSVLQLPAR